MANRTAWTAGNGAGFTWTNMFATTDIAGLTNGGAVLSSTSISNQTNLDLFSDVSVEFTIASATIAAGSYFAIYIAPLNEDGSIYGDNNLVAGTQKAYTPPWTPAAIIPLANATMTKLVGYAAAIPLPAQSFSWVLYNGSGQTISATTANNAAKFITENINLNA